MNIDVKNGKKLEKYLLDRCKELKSIEIHKCNQYIIILYELHVKTNAHSGLHKYRVTVPSNVFYCFESEDFDAFEEHVYQLTNTINGAIEARLEILNGTKE